MVLLELLSGRKHVDTYNLQAKRTSSLGDVTCISIVHNLFCLCLEVKIYKQLVKISLVKSEVMDTKSVQNNYYLPEIISSSGTDSNLILHSGLEIICFGSESSWYLKRKREL